MKEIYVIVVVCSIYIIKIGWKINYNIMFVLVYFFVLMFQIVEIFLNDL